MIAIDVLNFLIFSDVWLNINIFKVDKDGHTEASGVGGPTHNKVVCWRFYFFVIGLLILSLRGFCGWIRGKQLPSLQDNFLLTFLLHTVNRFEDQLPCRTGPQTHHSRVNVQQNKECLIQISKFKFSLVISGLTKILQRINELRPSHMEFERDYYESLLIVLDTLEKCLSSQAQQVKYDEAMNVKLLLREICQFLDTGNIEI